MPHVIHQCACHVKQAKGHDRMTRGRGRKQHYVPCHHWHIHSLKWQSGCIRHYPTSRRLPSQLNPPDGAGSKGVISNMTAAIKRRLSSHIATAKTHSPIKLCFKHLNLSPFTSISKPCKSTHWNKNPTPEEMGVSTAAPCPLLARARVTLANVSPRWYTWLITAANSSNLPISASSSW